MLEQDTAAAITTTGPAQLQQLDELMLALATGFIGLAVEHIDAAIEDGLRRMVMTLGVDRCGISRVMPDTGDIRFSYSWSQTGFPRSSTPVVAAHWPWAFATARRGQIVAFTRLDELPPQASVDRLTWQGMGTRSHITVPVMMAGEVTAMLHLGCFRFERDWPEALRLRLRRVAEIFAIALARKHAQEALDRAIGFERVATSTLAALLVAGHGAQGRAIEAGLGQIGRLLGVDWVAVWERDAPSGELRRTHQWRAGPASIEVEHLGAAQLPWLHAALAERRVVHFSHHAELPAEAEADLPALQAFSIRSLLAVPIAASHGGAGVLSCASLHEDHAWPERTVHGVELLAEVFASMHERRLAEKREQAAVLDAAQWRERLAHLVRVHTVGEMSAALTHEINQPLMAIANYAIAARRRAAELPRSEKVAELLDKVIAQTARAGDVVGRLRGMVKRNDIQLAAIDFERLIAECVDMVRMECELRDIRLECRLDGPLPAIVADGIQLQQVLLNLLRNAIEAMDATQATQPDVPREILIEVALVEDREVTVCVTDRGPGIAPEDLERVFDAFYSTKITGLGIGLSLCRKLIEAHGGTLGADNHAAGGAQFRFTLPVADASAPDSR